MSLYWFASPANGKATKRRAYADVMETLRRPVVETVGSVLGGAYAYNEVVATQRSYKVPAPPFDENELRDRIFAKGDALPQLVLLKDCLVRQARDAEKRLVRLETQVPIDIWNLAKLCAAKVLAGDRDAHAHCEQLVSSEKGRRGAYSVLLACVASKELHAQIAANVTMLAASNFDAADLTSSKDKKSKKSRRRVLAQLTSASHYSKTVYGPATNFCSLAVWLRETLDNRDVDPVKLYRDYAEREREIFGGIEPVRPTVEADRPADDKVAAVHPEPASLEKKRADSTDESNSASSADDEPPKQFAFWGRVSFHDFVEDEGPIFI